MQDDLFSPDMDPLRLIHQLLCTPDDVTLIQNAHTMFRICISGPSVYHLINGAHKLSAARCSTCNIDGEQFMNIIKGALHILIITPVFPLTLPVPLQCVLGCHGDGGVPLQARVVVLR